MSKHVLCLLMLFAPTFLFADDGQANGQHGGTPKPGTDLTPDEIVKGMVNYMASRNSTHVHMFIELRKSAGDEAPEKSDLEMTFQRPNRLAIAWRHPSGNSTIYCDGRKLHTHSNEHRVEDAPRNLFMSKNRDLWIILRSYYAVGLPTGKANASLFSHSITSKYVGVEKIGDATCHHLRNEQAESIVNVWISTGKRKLPVKIVVESRPRPDEKSNGSQTTTFRDWKVDFQPKAERFTFVKPEDLAPVK